MKPTTIVPKTTEPPKRTQPALPDEARVKLTRESISLSAERIEEGASTKTELLAKILERSEKTSHLRHWGINE